MHDHEYGQADPWLGSFHVSNNPGAERQKLVIVYEARANEAAYLHQAVGLENKTRLGLAWIGSDGLYRVSRGGCTSGNRAPAEDPNAPPPGKMVAFRSCDEFARALSRTEGTPRCELYWPEAKRDEAITAAVAFLKKYGDRYRHRAGARSDEWAPSWQRPPMSFPRYDRPATVEEALEGLAIFSLEGEGERRLWQMPAFPMKAKWTTLKNDAEDASWYNRGSEEAAPEIVYRQGGLVWQAEEVLRGGRWARHFGFVGSYVVAKVPASEIEFPAGDKWSRLSRGLGCRIVADDMIDKEYFEPSTSVNLGAPAEIALMLRNRRGIEQRVPGVFYRKRDRSPSELRSGIKIELLRVREGPKKMAPVPYSHFPIEEEVLDEVEPRRFARFDSDERGRELVPTEEIEALRVDLRDLFEITRPGTYRVRVSFTEGSGLGKGRTEDFELRVEESKEPRETSR